mgnify:CR=1 FL=1
MTKLKAIKEFNMLQRNLELTKALQDVDRLKAENLALKAELDEWKDEIIQMPGVVVRTDYEEEAERLKSKL